MTELTIPRRLIDKALHKVVPFMNEVVAVLKENAGHDGLTPKLRALIEQHGASGWAAAYDDPKALMQLLTALPFAIDASILQPALQANLGSQADIQLWLDAVWAGCERWLDEDDDGIEALLRQAQPVLAEPDDTVEPISREGFLLVIALVMCHNSFACMVHRQSLFQLVAAAKAGDDHALLKAVQIDKACLTDIPYFQARLTRAAVEGDTRFVQRVTQYRAKPAFQSATQLQPLYLVFSFLDTAGLLDDYAGDLERFADLCQSLGVYGPADDAADLDSFARTLRRFQAQYQTQRPTPKFRCVSRTRANPFPVRA